MEETSIIVLPSKVEASKTGLIFNSAITYNEWEWVGSQLQTVEGAIHWWIGDWLNYGEKSYGETYAQAIDETGYDYSTLRHDKWVADRIELCRRRHNLTWSHHAEVASLDSNDQDMLLDKAEKKEWSREKLRSEVSAYKLRKATSERQKQLATRNDSPLLTLHTGDALEIIKTIPDESVDLIIVDPPYNVDKAEWDSFGSGSQYAMWAASWLLECKRVLRSSGSIYVFGVNRMLSHLQHVLDGIGMVYRNWIVWDIIEGPGGGLWVNRYEAILYYSKTNNPYEDPESVKLERHEENIREYKGVEYNFKNPSNIWRFIRVDDSDINRTEHPTQKPVPLIERMVLANSFEGQVVLDPFVGSGTSAVAAIKNGRIFIGIDNNPDYIELTRYRVQNEII